jgi:hypothetical protein
MYSATRTIPEDINAAINARARGVGFFNIKTSN